MTETMVLTSLGASLMTLALMLGVLRLRSRKSAAAAVSLVAGWLRLSTSTAAATVAALAALSVLSFAQIDPGSGEWRATPSKVAGKTEAKTLTKTMAWTLPGLPDAQCRAADSTDGGCDPALEGLRNYAGTLDPAQQVADASGGMSGGMNGGSPAAVLPDVDTMIARLAKRLETERTDINGWKTLGWSYQNTGRYRDSVTAYETAVSLDPSNADLIAALDTARSKLQSIGDGAKSPPSTAAAETAPASAPAAPADQTKQDSAPPAQDQQAMIRGMVERLAARLEASPLDADGWLKLMKSRTVLGEKDLAQEALGKALAAFANDKTEHDRIADAAKEFGLSAQ